jgi:hypothetical protein
MNVLILTPDAVGSTLLQRLITIYMQFHDFDRPVINLHELTNGLVKYHNSHLDQEVLGKKEGKWGYYQTLEEIVNLLDSTTHYKTSRLAQYHIISRQDPISDQIPFYQYLNDNFYIISCRRHNIFEHAVSMCLNKVTKKLNVYSDDEKINSFFQLYQEGVDLDSTNLIQTLDAYKNYLEWTNNHFNVSSHFYYDQQLPDIENYILNLPIFAGKSRRVTWKDKFGIDFNDWNRCHYYNSDIGTLAMDQPEKFAQLAAEKQLLSYESANGDKIEFKDFLKNYQDAADPSWPKIDTIEDYENLPAHILNEIHTEFNIKKPSTAIESTQQISTMLSPDHTEFIARHRQQYQDTADSLNVLCQQGLMITPPPIKKQTLAEKKYMIRNFDQCLDIYNQWIAYNSTAGNPLELTTLKKFAEIERRYWQPTIQITSTSAVAQLSGSQNTD